MDSLIVRLAIWLAANPAGQTLVVVATAAIVIYLVRSQ
jgi:hypothetical protein